MEPNTLNRSDFAGLLGCAPSYITKLGKGGGLVENDAGQVLVLETLHHMRREIDLRPKIAARVDQLIGERAADAADVYSMVSHVQELLYALSSDDVAQVLKAAAAGPRLSKNIDEARIKAAQADQAEMERDKLAGNLILREDVDFVLNDYGATLRVLIENLPDKLAPVVYPLKAMEEIHAAIAEAATHLLDEMAETMKRRGEEARQS